MLLSKYKRESGAWNKHVVPYYESETTSLSADTVHPFRLIPWLLELDSAVSIETFWSQNQTEVPNKYLHTELGFNQKGGNHKVDPNNAWTASNTKRAEDQIQEKNIPSVSGVGEKSSELSGPNCGYCTCFLISPWAILNLLWFSHRAQKH